MTTIRFNHSAIEAAIQHSTDICPKLIAEYGGMVFRLPPLLGVAANLEEYLLAQDIPDDDARHHIPFAGTDKGIWWIIVAHTGFPTQKAAEAAVKIAIAGAFPGFSIERIRSSFPKEGVAMHQIKIVAPECIPVQYDQPTNKQSNNLRDPMPYATLPNLSGVQVVPIRDFAEETVGVNKSHQSPTTSPTIVIPQFIRLSEESGGTGGTFSILVVGGDNIANNIFSVERGYRNPPISPTSPTITPSANTDIPDTSVYSANQSDHPPFVLAEIPAGCCIFIRPDIENDDGERQWSRCLLSIPEQGQYPERRKLTKSLLPACVPAEGDRHLTYTYRRIDDPSYPSGLTFDPVRMRVYYNQYDHTDLSVHKKYSRKKIDQFRRYLKWAIDTLFGGNEDQFTWYLNAKAIKFQRKCLGDLKHRTSVFSSPCKDIGKTLWSNHIAVAINPPDTMRKDKTRSYSFRQVVARFAVKFTRQMVINEDTLDDPSLFEYFKELVTEIYPNRETKFGSITEFFNETTFDLCVNDWKSISPDSRRLVFMDTVRGTVDDEEEFRREARKWAGVYGGGSSTINAFGVEIMRALLTAIQPRQDWINAKINGHVYDLFSEDKKFDVEGFLFAVDAGHIQLPCKCKVADVANPRSAESAYKLYDAKYEPSPYNFAKKFRKLAQTVEVRPGCWVYRGKNFDIRLEKERGDTNWITVTPVSVSDRKEQVPKVQLDISVIWDAVESLVDSNDRSKPSRRSGRIIYAKGRPHTAADYKAADYKAAELVEEETTV